MNTSLLDRARVWGRGKYDSLFCEDWPEISKVGSGSSWHISTAGLNMESVVYSAGVGLDISFERELVERFGVVVELFDPSPTGIKTMQKPENSVHGINFHPVGLAGSSGTVQFATPKDPREGSYTITTREESSVNFRCYDLRDLMWQRGHYKVDLLKVDIEGFEYEVIDSIIQNKLDVRQICVEYHHFMKGIGLLKTLRSILKLKSAGYRLIYKTRFDYTFLHVS